MTHRRQGFPGLGADSALDRGGVAFDEAPAWSVGSGLRVLPPDLQPQKQLHMPLSLHRAAHDAEGGVVPAMARDESRNDRVERALGTTDLVRMARLQREAKAAVLQADPGPGDHDPRPKA